MSCCRKVAKRQKDRATGEKDGIWGALGGRQRAVSYWLLAPIFGNMGQGIDIVNLLVVALAIVDPVAMSPCCPVIPPSPIAFAPRKLLFSGEAVVLGAVETCRLMFNFAYIGWGWVDEVCPGLTGKLDEQLLVGDVGVASSFELLRVRSPLVVLFVLFVAHHLVLILAGTCIRLRHFERTNRPSHTVDSGTSSKFATFSG